MSYTARFLWQNRYVDAATLSAASAATGYPVTALQDQLRARRWRATGISSEYVQVDFGQARPFNAVALVDHNLTFEGQVIITASNSPGGSDLLNITADIWGDLIGYGEDRYGYLGYGGKFEEGDRSYMVPRPIGMVYLEDHSINEPVEARYVRLTFSDTANADGYLEFGRLLMGLYDDFGLNFSSISHEVLDESDLEIAPGGGQLWGVEYPVRNSLSLTFDWVSYADKYWLLLHMAQKMGLTKYMLLDAFPNPGYPSERHFGRLYGRFESLPRFDQSGSSPFKDGHRISMVDLIFGEVL